MVGKFSKINKQGGGDDYSVLESIASSKTVPYS